MSFFVLKKTGTLGWSCSPSPTPGQSATTGMPQRLCRGNMEKIRFVLDEMERVLGGLTRGLDLRALDDGWVEQGGRPRGGLVAQRVDVAHRRWRVGVLTLLEGGPVLGGLVAGGLHIEVFAVILAELAPGGFFENLVGGGEQRVGVDEASTADTRTGHSPRARSAGGGGIAPPRTGGVEAQGRSTRD